MKKNFIYAASALLLFAASCKEYAPAIDKTEGPVFEDSTYVGAVDPPDTKRVLIEELSGVTCTNCPQGAEKLEALSNQYPNQLSIVTIHTGVFTDPIDHGDIKSKQNLQTDDGILLRNNVWGEQGNKPTAAFDRLPIGNQGNKFFINGYTTWPDAIVTAKNTHPNSPVNIAITSKYNDQKDEYEIDVTVKYTQATTGQQALHIFLIENKIIDVQEYSPNNFDQNYEFNHVFRKAITPATAGKLFLTDMTSKEAGRVYMYHTALKIDPTDDKQKFWKPENMKLVAFVSASAPDDIHVMQVEETDLK